MNLKFLYDNTNKVILYIEIVKENEIILNKKSNSYRAGFLHS